MESFEVTLCMPRVHKLSLHSPERLKIRISLHRVEEVEIVFFYIDVLLFLIFFLVFFFGVLVFFLYFECFISVS